MTARHMLQWDALQNKQPPKNNPGEKEQISTNLGTWKPVGAQGTWIGEMVSIDK